MRPDTELIVALLSAIRRRHGLERALKLATTMIIAAASIISRELGQAQATRLLDDAASILPPQRRSPP